MSTSAPANGHGSVTLTVDGRPVAVPAGASVLDAVNRLGIALPQLCKDPDRPRLGTCRTCLVGIHGVRGPVAACAIPVVEGMQVHTDDPVAVRIRAGVLQLTVDMLPEAELARTRDLAVAAANHGVERGRFLPEPPIAHRAERDESNPFWLLDHSRCILCERCVAACQNEQHIAAIAVLARSRETRIGVFDFGPIVSSTCTSCGQCWSTCPTGAIRSQEIGPHPRPLSPAGERGEGGALRRASSSVSRDGNGAATPDTPLPRTGEGPGVRADTPILRRVETVCPYCGVGCGLVLNIGPDDRIVGVDDVPENLSSRGMLCVKGRFGLGFVHSPDRLTTPLIRRRAGGPLEPATWDEALDLVAERFVAHKGRFGAFGSAKTTNEDSYVVQKFARAVMGTNNVDHCARLCHSPSMAGMLEMLGSGSTTNSYADFERAGCLMVVGSDTDANHPVVAARIRKGVQENGVRLIVVNPRRTRLCDIADLWLQPKPGTDIALFNGLARIALDEGLWDRDFVERRTEGFAAYRDALAPYHPAAVAAVTSVPEDDLRRAVRLFARPERGNSSLLWGMGITQHTRGTHNVQAMVDFALLTGMIGKPGSGLSPLRGQNNVQGCCDVGVLPDNLPGYGGLTPESREKFGRVWGVGLPAEPGLRLTQMFEAMPRGEIRALYVCGENPMLSEADLNHTRQALSALDFLVAQTTFLNETTDLAHVVLPAACFAEKDGTFTNSERRVQLVRKAVDPPGGARADWEITCEIARRVAAKLGVSGDGFAYRHPSEIWAELASLWPAVGGISHERLAAGGIQWPCPQPDHPGTPLLFTETFPRGRAKFVFVDQGMPAAELPDADYPLLLNTGRVLYHWHGGDLTRRVEGLVELYPRVEVAIHPADAAALGVAEGDRVRVASRRGELLAVAHLTDAQRCGEVFIPFVQLEGAAANVLTNSVYDPRARIPEYKVCAVRVGRA